MPNASSSETIRSIAGRFVGDDLSWLSGISAFGALLRTAHLNAFERPQVFTAYGLRFLRREDVSRVLAFSDSRKNALGAALGINTTQRALWNIEPWLPFTGGLDWDVVPWAARLCPCCARSGYHSLLFQLPWIERCPWHGAALIRECLRCKRTLSVAASASIIGQCECGYEYVNTREACRYKPSHRRDADRWVAEYLAWADAARRTAVLVPASRHERANWEALGQLVELPLKLRYRCGRPCSRVPVLHGRTIGIVGVDRLGDDVSSLLRVPVTADGVLELPRIVWKPFRAVGYNIAEKLPDASLCDGELLRFLDGSPRKILKLPFASRRAHPEIIFLPVQVGGQRGFLYVNSLAKHVRELVHALGDMAPAVGSARHLFVRAGLSLLLRAYAEGIRVILSRFIPFLFQMPRDHARLTAPWVLLRCEGDVVPRAKLVWAPLAGDQQSVLANITRNNQRRRAPPLVLPRRKPLT